MNEATETTGDAVTSDTQTEATATDDTSSDTPALDLYGLVGRKVGMTRIPHEDELAAVTLIKVETQKVTAVMNAAKNGYHALQIGYDTCKEKKLRQADRGRLRKAGIDENFARTKEFRSEQPVPDDCVGTPLTIAMLKDVKLLDVQGVVKGRGFQGAVKRWGHKTGKRTHGSRFHRRPGSLGGRAAPARVFKNKKLPGQMGNINRTIQNLPVLAIDSEQNLVAVKGSVPGQRGGFVILKPAVKAQA